MNIRNTHQDYGLVSRLLHWISAVWVFGLFCLGVWMVTLDYYSSWCHDAPAIHKSMGVLLMGLILLRLIWRWMNPQPTLLNTPNPLMQRFVHWLHAFLYGLILMIGLSGYLISTAEGQDLAVFDWFSLPVMMAKDGQADLAGLVHQTLAYGLMGLLVLHIAGALKHHFWDKDVTLKRMLWTTKGESCEN
ncbi:MAG: cytochrome b [Thiotrichales bacterium]|nr:cytochrome b [Thiotrichales bacterium]